MAKIKELTVLLSKKVSDDNYGSKSVTAGLTVALEDGDDKDVEYAALASWCAEKIGGTLKAHGALPSQTEPPKKAAAPVATGGAIPDAEDVFTAETITVEYTPGGEKRAKIKGGRWKKYGVMCWPEVLALPPLEWDLDALDATDYPVPAGVQAIVLMVDDKPKKVVGWK